MGSVEQALKAMDEALSVMGEKGERWREAELYRQKGELLLMKGVAIDEVERHFLRALEVARRQGAKVLELKAAVSLSRFWRQHGRKEEARQMLAETYSCFSKGLDAPDLREARALLDAAS